MKLIRASAKILDHNPSYGQMLNNIAGASALCYNTTVEEHVERMEHYIQLRMAAGHNSVLEHSSISVLITTDRGVTHELVRHRICSFTQESTRYCNYSKDKYDGHVTFVLPPWFANILPGVYQQDVEAEKSDAPDPDYFINSLDDSEFSVMCGPDDIPAHYFDPQESIFMYGLWQAEASYLKALRLGLTPEKARGLLPHHTKADIVVTANIREWRHILSLRALGTTGRPHPQMVEIMQPLLAELKQRYPVFFKDLGSEEVKNA